MGFVYLMVFSGRQVAPRSVGMLQVLLELSLKNNSSLATPKKMKQVTRKERPPQGLKGMSFRPLVLLLAASSYKMYIHINLYNIYIYTCFSSSVSEPFMCFFQVGLLHLSQDLGWGSARAGRDDGRGGGCHWGEDVFFFVLFSIFNWCIFRYPFFEARISGSN